MTTKHVEISSLSPHFFRIILPHILQNGTLELPREFVKKHWKSLSNYACLELPTGVESKIEINKCNGRACLDKGWQDFVEKYSIKYGYFLLFKYQGGSRFNVTIFDLSTSEIEYPRTSHKRKVIEIKEEDCEGNTRKTRIGQCKSIGNARDRVLQRAKAFRSENLHFMVIMTPAYVSKSYLHVPEDAATGSYFRKKENNNIYLNISGAYGRAWPMKFILRAPSKNSVRFYSGWGRFSHDNNLQEGDICAFELIISSVGVFKVTIFRITDNDSSQELKENPKKMEIGRRKGSFPAKDISIALQRARDFKSNEPSFAVEMRKSYVEENCRLVIPASHSSKHLMDQHGNEIILHRLDGETWTVKCYVRGLEARFSTGWKDFAVDNELRVGDACVFELFPDVPNHYKVTIFRVAESLDTD